MNTKVIYDTRSGGGDLHPVMIRLYIDRKRFVQFSLGILVQPSQFEGGRVVHHRDAMRMNLAISRALSDVMTKAEEIEKRGLHKTLTPRQVKAYVLGLSFTNATPTPTGTPFIPLWEDMIRTKDRDRTRGQYKNALTLFLAFLAERGREGVMLSEIDYPLITDFLIYLKGKGYAVNTIFNYFKCFKAVYNTARLRGLTEKDPFLGVRVKQKKESDTLPLTIEQVKMIKNYKATTKAGETARDVFMLTFYLMGINYADLIRLPFTIGDCLHYERQKTGVRLSFDIPCEVRYYMEKYRDPKGEKMFRFPSSYPAICMRLKEIGKAIGEPSLHLYHARHTFATIAFTDCALSLSDVGQMLGHKEHSVTSIYARPSDKRVNLNLRKVLDTIKE